MDKKADKERLKVIANIQKNVDNKKWKCLHPGCEDDAINSHLLQRNGVLNNIVDNGHLIEIKANDMFKMEEMGHLSFKNVGVKNAISYPLFCNKHDTEVFKIVETYPIDFEDYRVQLLFSYRSLCAELRKKENAVETFKRILNSNILNPNPFHKNLRLETQKKANEIGISDITVFKTAMEKDLQFTKTQNFVFKTFIYDEMKICVSAVFSPLDPETSDLKKAVEREKPLNNVYINVIPQKGQLIIIAGYHKDFKDKWITDFLDSWANLDKTALENKLTNLIATKVETWCMAISLFNSIPKITQEKFAEYWEMNMSNIDLTQGVDFNLFSEN